MEYISEIIFPIIAGILSLTSLILAWRGGLLSKGEIEFQIANLIKDTQYRVADSGIEVKRYREEVRKRLAPNEDIDDVLSEDEFYEILQNAFEQSVEIMLNAYEECCAKYLDKKVDSKRFKRTYHRQIRKLVEDEDFTEEFNANTSPYKCILKVYNRWYNLEK